MSTHKPLYWAVFREQHKHEVYIELEDLGRNRWQAVVGEDEFTFREKSKDFLTVLQRALHVADVRRAN